MTGAAFFDLDRTVISRSSALALAGAFRDRGLIRRRQLVRAGLTQLVFSRLAADEARVREMSERGMAVLAGVPVQEVRGLVAGALETALKPLVYRGALERAERHRQRGEPVFIVSAALQEVVEALAEDLGFAGALGSTCEEVDGVFTGRLERACYGQGKAAALRGFARERGLDLARSTAYSDSVTDLAFLEAVGTPVAVNPDRALLALATERGWEVAAFHERAYPAGVSWRPAAAVVVAGTAAAAWAVHRRRAA